MCSEKPLIGWWLYPQWDSMCLRDTRLWSCASALTQWHSGRNEGWDELCGSRDRVHTKLTDFSDQNHKKLKRLAAEPETQLGTAQPGTPEAQLWLGAVLLRQPRPHDPKSGSFPGWLWDDFWDDYVRWRVGKDRTSMRVCSLGCGYSSELRSLLPLCDLGWWPWRLRVCSQHSCAYGIWT